MSTAGKNYYICTDGNDPVLDGSTEPKNDSDTKRQSLVLIQSKATGTYFELYAHKGVIESRFSGDVDEAAKIFVEGVKKYIDDFIIERETIARIDELTKMDGKLGVFYSPYEKFKNDSHDSKLLFKLRTNQLQQRLEKGLDTNHE